MDGVVGPSFGSGFGDFWDRGSTGLVYMAREEGGLLAVIDQRASMGPTF